MRRDESGVKRKLPVQFLALRHPLFRASVPSSFVHGQEPAKYRTSRTIEDVPRRELPVSCTIVAL